MGIAGCNKTPEIPDGPDDQTPVDKVDPEPAEPVTLTAYISEAGPDAVPATRATLNESTGAFAFSEGDVIMVYNGTGTYTSTGINLDGPTARFTMEEGFEDTGSGLAALTQSDWGYFGEVCNIYSDGVTYTLPDKYEYDQVGSSNPVSAYYVDAIANAANNAKVPCPMIASYTAGQPLYFKQAAAVVRFRITNCLAGSLTFTFTTPVTGFAIVSSVPSGASGGIHYNNLQSPGYSITVNNVPAVDSDQYIFITLPVPIGTDPMNVGVWNNQVSSNYTVVANRVATLSGTANPLNRAEGQKRGVSLVDVKDAATFDGLYLDGYLYCDNYSAATPQYTVVDYDPIWILPNYNVDYTTNKFYFNWDFLNEHGFCTAGGVKIGNYNYIVPSGGATNSDWASILGTTRGAATIKGQTGHYACLKVTGLDVEKYKYAFIRGILFFPDNAILTVPGGTVLNYFDNASLTGNNEISYQALSFLVHQGCAFLPLAGYCENWFYVGWSWGGINEGGYYWSSYKVTSKSEAYALAIEYDSDKGEYSLYSTTRSDDEKNAYFPVRLIRLPASSN